MKPNLLKLLPLTPYLCRYGVGPLLRRRRLLSDAVALPKEPQSNKIFWSQNGQGRFFINELFAGQKKGVFIDVGANDGITFSNTYALEQIGWTGICIEPHPDIFLKLRGNRSCECICAAAVDGSDASSLEFWKLSSCHIENSMLSGFPKFMNTFQKGRIERLVQLGEVGRQSLQVPTLKLAEHLLNNGVTTPDLVCVDVEGAEWSIVMDLCNNGVTPRAFCIENNELHYLLCYEMYKRGYELAAVKGGDEIYVR